MKIKTWLKWNHNSCPRWIEPRNPIDENPKKFKDLKIIVLHYTTIATIKKTNYKKLFSEDIYTTIFSPVSQMIDMCALKRILFLVFVQ